MRVRPDLGEAHLELARYYYYANLRIGDFDRARDELAIARRTLPNNAEALVMGARIDKRQNRWDDALANFQKASGLDPRNDEVAMHHRCTLREMRRYNELEQLFAKDAESGLIRDPWTQLGLAMLKLEQGDPVAAQALLAQVPLEFSPHGVDMDNSIYCSSLPAGLRRGESGDCRYSCEVRRCIRRATSGELG